MLVLCDAGLRRSGGADSSRTYRRWRDHRASFGDTFLIAAYGILNRM